MSGLTSRSHACPDAPCPKNRTRCPRTMMRVPRLSALLLTVLTLSVPVAVDAAAKKSHRPARPSSSVPAFVTSGDLAPGDADATARDFGRWLDAVEQSGQVAGLAAAVVSGDKVLLQRGIG